MAEKSNKVTVTQLAARFGVSTRTVHHWLLSGKSLDGVESYEKLNPDNRNSPYIIIVNKKFWDRRKSLAKPVADEVDYLR